jgi:hypothetical protein
MQRQTQDSIQTRIHQNFRGILEHLLLPTEGFKNPAYTQRIKTLKSHAASIRTGKIFPVQSVSNVDSEYEQCLIPSNTHFHCSNHWVLLKTVFNKSSVTLKRNPWPDKAKS